MSDYRKPVPVASLESKPYWEGIRQHKLLLPRCDACEYTWFPPSHLCPRCGSGSVGWAESGGRGNVFSFVVFHRAYHPGFAEDVPYAVALIALDEGPRLLGNVVGISHDRLACEMRVRVAFEDVAEGVTLPRFKVEA